LPSVGSAAKASHRRPFYVNTCRTFITKARQPSLLPWLLFNSNNRNNNNNSLRAEFRTAFNQ
jgi:hypothetical protein